MKNELKNYGFNPELIEIKPEEYVFGAEKIPMVVIKPDGQYDDFLPIYEPQAEKYETSGCTVWGSQNQAECYFKKVFGFEPNFAEIFNYILAGVTLAGANPQNAYESIRNDGVVDNALLPIPDTYEQFSNPKQITSELKAKGKQWLEQYDFKHEWLIVPTKEQIKNTLPYSPVAIAVTAWIEQDGLYIDNGQPNTHWCLCYGYIEDERGIILKIFDSYDHSKKLLHPDHKISVAKRIYIKKKEQPTELKETPKISWWSLLLDFIKAIFA
ncbi:MAG: hypothetical protein L6Q29_03430 [Candidatus Pacebacteria bacterium]|nr:hypothetical protein [Candidatus Paceibacterota bacterium]NUQ57509.1 hypothetical protein [Candidatus Paceibacter sp.]